MTKPKFKINDFIVPVDFVYVDIILVIDVHRGLSLYDLEDLDGEYDNDIEFTDYHYEKVGEL